MANRKKYIHVETREERFFTDMTYAALPAINGQEKCGWIPAEDAITVNASTPVEAVRAQKAQLTQKLKSMNKEELIDFAEGIDDYKVDKRKSEEKIIEEIINLKFNV